MAKKTYEVVRSRPVYGSRQRNRNGDAVRLGTKVQYADGRVGILLTPAGRGRKYAAELASGVKMTNDGQIKKTKSGKDMRLTKPARAYRSGYLDSRKDSAKCYNSKRK